MWNDVLDWLKKPFNSQGDALHWFLFIGFLLVSLRLWAVIAHDWQKLEG